MTASLAMQYVRLLLASALLMVGCAADDSLSAGPTAVAVTEAPPADAAAPASDPEAEPVSGDAASESTAPEPAATADATPTTAAPTSDTATPTTAAPTSDTATPTTAAPTSDTATPTTAAPTSDTATPTTAAPTTAAPTTTDTATPTTATPTTAAPTTAAPTTTAPQPSIDGSVVFFEATCDSCHRGDGEGTGADLRSSTLGLDAVIKIIRFGVAGTDMDGWDFEPKPPGLTREEIEAVAAYVMTLRRG